jgi:hypothetical protein
MPRSLASLCGLLTLVIMDAPVQSMGLDGIIEYARDKKPAELISRPSQLPAIEEEEQRKDTPFMLCKMLPEG